MSIKPGSQRRLVQISSQNSDFKSDRKGDFESDYSIHGEPTQIVFVSKQKENLFEENFAKNENCAMHFGKSFNISQIYELKPQEF